MATSNLQAQYTKAAGDARRTNILAGLRRLPSDEITIRILEEILDEQEFQILCETPFSELFQGTPASVTSTAVVAVRETKTPREKKNPPTNGAAPRRTAASHPADQDAPPKAKKTETNGLGESLLKIIAGGDAKGTSAKTLADGVNREIKEIRTTVNALLAEGVITSTGNTRGTRYHIPA